MTPEWDVEELAETDDGLNEAMAGWYAFDRNVTDVRLADLSWNDCGNGPEPTGDGVFGPFKTEALARDFADQGKKGDELPDACDFLEEALKIILPDACDFLDGAGLSWPRLEEARKIILENADLIVRSVNAHDALLAACEAGLALLRTMPATPRVERQLEAAIALAKPPKGQA